MWNYTYNISSLSRCFYPSLGHGNNLYSNSMVYPWRPRLICKDIIDCVSKIHSTFGHNFGKSRLIFKTLSLADSKRNCICRLSVKEIFTSSQLRCYTTLWNSKIQNIRQTFKIFQWCMPQKFHSNALFNFCAIRELQNAITFRIWSEDKLWEVGLYATIHFIIVSNVCNYY